MLEEILRETWLYQKIMKEAHERYQERVRGQFLLELAADTLREALVEVVRVRFPEIVDIVEKELESIQKTHIMFWIHLKICVAKDAHEVLYVLFKRDELLRKDGYMEPLTVKDMVADARSRIKGLSKEEMERELASGEALVVDIRDVRERWRGGTIPGSKHVPRGMLEFWADPESEYHKPFMQRERKVILFCAGGLRSALAADVLQKMGYQDVNDLEMGFDAWKNAGGASQEVPVPDNLRG